MIGTAQQPDGTKQVVYNGHPLYLYAGDQKAGQENGQGVDAYGALWYVVSPAGQAVAGAAPSSGVSGY